MGKSISHQQWGFPQWGKTANFVTYVLKRLGLVNTQQPRKVV